MPEQIFTIRIYKNLGGKGAGKEWSNEYTVLYPEATTVETPDLTRLAIELAGMESYFSYNSVKFNRAVISTYFPDQDSLLPTEKTVGLSYSGQRIVPVGGQLYPLEAVVKVNFSASSGRAGYKEYRGWLATSDISGDSLTFGPTTGTVNLWTGGFLDLITNQADVFPLLRIATGKGNQVVARAVTSVAFAGIVFQKRTANRRPKVSLDQDAIQARLKAVIKELLFLNASIGAAKALGGLTEQADINALVAQAQAAATAIPAA
jgi:hypothetical protein